jgi:serine protease AprX
MATKKKPARAKAGTAKAGSTGSKRGARPAPARLSYAPGLQKMVAESPTLSNTVSELRADVTFTIAPKTVSGEPIQAQRGRLRERNIDDFRPAPDAVQKAAERMTQLGFSIKRVGRFVITASGPSRLVSEVMKVELAVQARPRRSLLRATQNFAVSYEPPRTDDLYVAPVQSLTVKSKVSKSVDDFVFIPPPLFFAASPTPPAHGWHGLDPKTIRKLLQVPSDGGGKGVTVGLVDTGFFRHPYYEENELDYRPTPTLTAPNPEQDENGHGTAIAYNVFAAAPGATVLGFQQTSSPENALEAAADAGVDILSCSWGWDGEQSFPTVELSIRSIVEEGKIVLFASGNGERAWPGSMPEVLSIGGVYADKQGNLEASNYASGFTSDLYPTRKVPDLSGLVGQKPRAIYIMMPCPPGAILDRALGGNAFPDRDETTKNDGWVGASGTSSATPQLAGVVALLIEKARSQGKTLRQDDVKAILQSTAVPVQKGNNAQGFPAVGHPNIAVGHGLVNAEAALAAV